MEIGRLKVTRLTHTCAVSALLSATLCHDAQILGLYGVSSSIHLTVLAAKLEDYTTAPQHLLDGK